MAEAILNFEGEKNLIFIIVGIGDYHLEMQEQLSKMIYKKQVFFLNYRQDIQLILKECDIFILPTLHETLSIALLEASVEGLALIASNTGGVPEILENKYNGLLFTPGNVNELVNSIKTISSDKKIREYFSNNAKIRIEEKFSSQIIQEKIDNMYKSVLK